jgi:hypothetical protein
MLAAAPITLMSCRRFTPFLPLAVLQFYQRLREGELTEDYLWETRLLPQLRYLSAAETVAVREALSLAYDAHSGQRRKSGEAFITHPVEVTRILAELRMDYESLVAGKATRTGGQEVLLHCGSI